MVPEWMTLGMLWAIAVKLREGKRVWDEMDKGSKGLVIQSPAGQCNDPGLYLKSNARSLKDFKQRKNKILFVFF